MVDQTYLWSGPCKECWQIISACCALMISHFVWQPKPQFQMSTNLSVRHRDEYRIPQHLMSVKVNDSMVIMYDGKRSG